MPRLKRTEKRLGGKAPRRTGRWLRQQRAALRADQPYGMVAMLAFALFVLGGVGGFAFAADRQVRGGILRQRVEAERRPDWVYIENLPRHVPEAFLAVVQPSLLTRGTLRPEEDGRSVAREMVHQIHLIPNSLTGEARAMVMAPVLEQRLASRELVELYLNRVYLGRSQGTPVYGLYHASRDYLDKEPSELTLGEAGTLAGLLLPPRIVDPRTRIGAVGARRNEVLRVMLEGELITPDEYRQATTEPLAFQPGLDQMPFSRPGNWGEESSVIRLPPSLRPLPENPTEPEEEEP